MYYEQDVSLYNPWYDSSLPVSQLVASENFLWPGVPGYYLEVSPYGHARQTKENTKTRYLAEVVPA